MVREFLLVGAGGAAGSMARYGVSYALGRLVSNPLLVQPLWVGTLAINILGSFVIGILFGLTARSQWLREGGYLLLASGFCGGFTTFSSFALENITLIHKGQPIMAILYTGASLVAGLLLCRAGIWLTN